MSNRIYSVTNWCLDFKPDGIYIKEGVKNDNQKPHYIGPHAPSGGKQEHPFPNNQNIFHNENKYGPITITNLRAWLKSPYMEDIEFTDATGKKFIAARANSRVNLLYVDELKSKLSKK